MNASSHKAVFLDRDATLIFDHGYMKDPKLVEVLPGVEQALQIFIKNGFKLFIVTCQSGVGRGMMTMDDVKKVNERVLELLGKDTFIDILICPHSPEDKCKCRKPGTLLVEQTAKKHNIDLKSSYSIGDKVSDKELGINMGGTGIRLGENGIKNLLDSANYIVHRG
ncbi:MAG: HAD family hydrolase [Pseudomonadota bacterium]